MTDQYIITKEQLLVMTSWATNKGVCLYEKRLSIATDVRSHPYNPQAEREKVLDEFKKWVIHDLVYCDSIGADHLFSHELILDKIARM